MPKDAARSEICWTRSVSGDLRRPEEKMKLVEAIGAGVADLPLRPLLFTAVTAATAGILCYLTKRGHEKETTADRADKTPPVAVCDQATDLSLLQKKEFPQHQVSLEEAEEQHQNVVESIAQLEIEESALQDKIETLQRTQEMLHEFNIECDDLTNEHKQVLETRNLLQVTNTEITEKLQHCEQLLMECEREQDSHSLLQVEYDLMKTLMHDEELLKVSLAEAAVKHQNDVESIVQLEAEKSDLQDKLDQMQEAHNVLQATNKEITEKLQHCEQLLMEREQVLETQKIKYKNMEDTLAHKETLLKVSLEEAEERHQNAVERIVQLEAENSAIQDKVETLQKTVKHMGIQLHESNKKCESLTNECEQVQESNIYLKTKYKEMEEALTHKEELLKAMNKEVTEKLQLLEQLLTEHECEREFHSLLQFENDELKVSLEEADEKHQNAVKSTTQLKAEKSVLQGQVETLQKTVQEMGNLLHESNTKCDQLMKEYEQEMETHNLLKIKYKEMEETLAHKESLMERKQMQEAHNILQAKNNEITEKLQLCEQLLMERERQSHSILQVEYDELKGSLEEAEEKHQSAVESITQLEDEKSALQDQVETLQKTVQEMGNLLHEHNKECSKLTNESKQEPETHNNPKINYKAMEETLAHRERFLKVSLMKVKESHQMAVETTAQVKEHMTDLTDEMENLAIGILNINLNS